MRRVTPLCFFSTFAFPVGFGHGEIVEGYVTCPPRDSSCIAVARRDEPEMWRVHAQFDKILAQRAFELLILYEQAPPASANVLPEDTPAALAKQNQVVMHALGVTEACRQLICAAAHMTCDANLTGRARIAAEPWAENASSAAAGKAASIALRNCGSQRFSICAQAVWDWEEAEYHAALLPILGEGSHGLANELEVRDAKKVASSLSRAALMFPPPLSPRMVCAFQNETLPLFGGEAFGDVAWVDVTNLRTRNLNMLSLFELLQNGLGFEARHPTGLSYTVVNIGTFDGVCRVGHMVDPANCLIGSGWGGIMVEANTTLGPVIATQVGHRPDVRVVLQAAGASNISDMLAAELPHLRPGRPVERDDIDLIKVDIDGPECELVGALLNSGWRPKVWHVEVNPLFPPGIALWPRSASASAAPTDLRSAFSRKSEDAATTGKNDPLKHKLSGCSVQALIETLPGYVFLHMEFENAVLVRRDIAGALEPWLSAHSDITKWHVGYFCHPLARLRMPHDDDEDSLFLHYDFRRFGDSALTLEELQAEVAVFLDEYVEADSYVWQAPVCASHFEDGVPLRVGSGLAWPAVRNDSLVADPDCILPWKGHRLEWNKLRGNLEVVLDAWTRGGGEVGPILTMMVENIVNVLNLDRAWIFFKAVAFTECPLGGLTIAAALQWRCGSSGWESDALAPHTISFFESMQHQLPIIRRFVSEGAIGDPSHGTPAELGCAAVLERYIRQLLRRADFSTIARSRWPVFEVLSALHVRSAAWPRGYP